jgi:hypothetical protein
VSRAWARPSRFAMVQKDPDRRGEIAPGRWGQEADRMDDPEDDMPYGLWLKDLERHTTEELRSWCVEFELEPAGSRAEVMGRLREFIEEEFPDVDVDLLPDGEVLGLGEEELRGLLARYGFESEGDRDLMASWLLWYFDEFREDVGEIESYSREELEAMPADHLRSLAGLWNVERHGGDLVERMLEAQEAGWPPRGGEHPREPPPEVIF